MYRSSMSGCIRVCQSVCMQARLTLRLGRAAQHLCGRAACAFGALA